MPRLPATLALALATLVCLQAVSALHAGERLDRQAEASGVFPDNRILRLDGRITEPQYSGEFTWRTMRPGLVRVTLRLGPEQVFEEGFDGSIAWEKPLSARAARASNANAREALRRGTVWLGHYRPLKELAGLGLVVEELADEELDGKRYLRIQASFPGNDATVLYLDPATHLIARTRTVKALHAGVEPDKRARIETVLDDWRRVGTLMIAFRSIDREIDTGKVLMTTEWRSATWQPGDASVFAMPR